MLKLVSFYKAVVWQQISNVCALVLYGWNKPNCHTIWKANLKISLDPEELQRLALDRTIRKPFLWHSKCKNQYLLHIGTVFRKFILNYCPWGFVYWEYFTAGFCTNNKDFLVVSPRDVGPLKFISKTTCTATNILSIFGKWLHIFINRIKIYKKKIA